MNRLAGWMMRLYPARWRARYGDELDALLADTGADARVVSDLFRGGIRMRFKTWSFPKLALALGMLGALLGAGLAFLLPNQYTSRATMEIQPAQISGGEVHSTIRNSLNEHIQQMETRILSSTTLAAIITDPRNDLYKAERRTEPLEEVIEKMKGAINIQFVTLPGALGKRAFAFDISFSYNDRYKARQTVMTLMSKFEELNQEDAAAAPKIGSLVVLNRASLPALPVHTKTPFAQYRSTATLALPQGSTAEQIASLQAAVFSRTSLIGMINHPQLLLYRDQLQTQPLEDVIEAMKQNLTVTPIHFRDLVFFDVSFDYPDAFKAQQALSMIVRAFSEADARLFPDLSVPPPAFTPEVMDVLDTASLPVRPTKPNRSGIVLAGAVWGVVAAAIIAMIRRRWKPQSDIPIDAVNG